MYKIPRWFIYCPPHGESTISTIIFPVYEDDTDVGLILPPVPNGKPFLYWPANSAQHSMVGKYSTFYPKYKLLYLIFMLYTRTSFSFNWLLSKSYNSSCFKHKVYMNQNLKKKSLFLHVLCHIHYHSVPMLNGWCTKGYLQY